MTKYSESLRHSNTLPNKAFSRPRGSHSYNRQKQLSDFLDQSSNFFFTKDVDQIWDEHDIAQNGFMLADDIKPFLDEIACVVKMKGGKGDGGFLKSGLKNWFYSYQQIDRDQNGYLSKKEMAELFKMVF